MRVSVIATAAFLTGCTLLVSTSGLEDGAVAATDTGDGGLTGPLTSDASSGDAREASTAFCVAQAVDLCFDFAAPLPFSAWNDVSDSGGTLTYADGTLLAETATTGEDFRPAYVQKSVPATRSFRVAADVRVERSESISEVQLGARFLGLRLGVNAFLAMRSGGAIALVENWGSDGGTKTLHGEGVMPPDNTWFRAELVYDLATNAVTATVDGVTISDGSALAGPVEPAKPIGAAIGLYFPPVKGDGFRVRYDNVIIDAE